MQIEAYFRSISGELNSLKNRVRYLIESTHWQTDGEWKESVLRTILQRSMPLNMTIGRGFIVDREQSSTQIDILIYDNSYPVLYKDGDLVFVTPAACRAIIEVKTSLTASNFLAAVKKLGNNAELVRGSGPRRNPLFVGLFSYDGPQFDMLDRLHQAAGDRSTRIVDHVSVGESQFVKFWSHDPRSTQERYQSWHQYELNQMAQGYFIHNLVTELSPNDEARQEAIWFPEEGKEVDLRAKLEFAGRLRRTTRLALSGI